VGKAHLQEKVGAPGGDPLKAKREKLFIPPSYAKIVSLMHANAHMSFIPTIVPRKQASPARGGAGAERGKDKGGEWHV
jgi:hypothetical protein